MRIIKSLILSLTIILWGSILMAQEYDSSYTTSSGISGHAQFDYYYDLDHLMVKNGHFHFETTSTDTFWTSVYEKLDWDGNYAENKKHGDWKYMITNHELDITSIEDDHLEYELRSLKTEITAHYDRGVPGGEWKYITKLIEKEKEPVLFEEISITFKKGYAEGAFSKKMYHDNGSFTGIDGQFENGFMVGTWTFQYPIGAKYRTEIRQYNQGVLEYSILDGDTLTFPLSPKTQKVLYENDKSHLGKRPKHITFNDGFPTRSVYFTSQLPGNSLLYRTQDKLFRFDEEWIRKQKAAFGVNYTFYPLTETDEIYIGKWYGVEQKYQDMVTVVKEHEIRSFGDSEDSIAVITLDWVKRQEYIFSRFRKLTQLFLSREVEYYYRDGLILERAVEILEQDTLMYNGQEIIVDYPTPEPSKKNLFSYLVANYNSRYEVAKEIDRLLTEIQTSASLEDELKRLPRQIEREKILIDSLYGLENPDEDVEALLAHIHNSFVELLVEEQLKAYHEQKDSEEKKAFGDSILLNLYTVKHIYETSVEITTRREYVDSLYTEYVFDAFTFSDNVPSRIKKRLFDQVQKIQLELLNRAIESATPKECLAIIQEIYWVQGALIFLRDKNTKTLEKNLSRADDLEQKLKLLHEVL